MIDYDWQRIDEGLFLEDEQATQSAGEWIGRTIAQNQTVTLSGNLGDGKTTLSKGIARGWGVTANVKSPTFNYFLTYSGERGLLIHLDAYRIIGADDYASLLIEEILEEPWLLLVEWPEQISCGLPSPILSLRIESAGEKTRRLYRLPASKP